MNKVENFNLEKTCRSCLTESEILLSLYSLAPQHSNVLLGDILFELFNVDWNNTTVLPKKICYNCENDLTKAYAFKLKTEESEKILLDYIKRKCLNSNANYNEEEVKSNFQHKFNEFFTERNFNSDSQASCPANENIALINEDLDPPISDTESVEIKPEIPLVIDREVSFDTKIMLKESTNVKCDYCNLEFLNKEQLQKHFLEEHSKLHKNSESENENFDDTETSVQNKESNLQIEDSKFNCNICEKEFANKKGLRRHLKIKHGNILEINFSDNTKFSEKSKSEASHLKNNENNCNSNEEDYNEESNVQNEKLELTTAKSKFDCLDCGKQFAYKRTLRRHMKRKHEEENNIFEGPKRSKSLISVENSENHSYTSPLGDSTDEDTKPQTKTVVSDNKDSIFKCNQCEKTFVYKRTLHRHVRQKHEAFIGNYKTYKCNKCSASFSCSQNLESHRQAHSQNKMFYCEKCDQYYVNNRNLQRHLKSHLSDKEKNNFKCIRCDQAFETKVKWGHHQKNHKCLLTTDNQIDFDINNCMPHQTKLLECKICGSSFQKIHLFREHFLSHCQIGSLNLEYIENSIYLQTILPPNMLNDCEKLINYLSEEIQNGRVSKFYSATNMIGNEIDISDSETDVDENQDKIFLRNRNYSCDNCNETFDRRYKILCHQRCKHNSEERVYKCELCGMTYVSLNLLEYHKKTQCNNEEKKFTCDLCKMKFMWKKNIEEHIKLNHSRTENSARVLKYSSKDKFTCEICQKQFTKTEYLDRHMNTHIPRDKKFECPTCKKKYSRKDNLRYHMKSHNDAENDGDDGKHFLCVFCGRKFRNSSNLIVHTRRHTGEKPFKCDFCEMGFPRSSDLRNHRRTHTGEKPHLCNTCGKGFSRSNKLRRHMRVHTGDRPYKCTYCDRAFAQSNDLTIHIRRHTGEKPYACGICGERFIQGTALQNHRKARGHFEDKDGIEVPFAHLSRNNPNPLNNAGRVDHISISKLKQNEIIHKDFSLNKPVTENNSYIMQHKVKLEGEASAITIKEHLENSGSDSLHNLKK